MDIINECDVCDTICDVCDNVRLMIFLKQGMNLCTGEYF